MARSSLGFVAMTQRQHEAEASRLCAICSHCCPNCEGVITVGEHESAGICSSCYWVALEEEEDASRRASYEEWAALQDQMNPAFSMQEDLPF